MRTRKGRERYTAFLSYSHTDETVAKRLHHGLENYRIPKRLREGKGKTLAPVFRDAAELSASPNLPDTIHQALSRSDRLIVLASPASRHSHWVAEEIRTFRELHPDRPILCASLSGDVADFPPALMESGHEPLAADLSGGQFRMGLLQLASSILGVGLDELVQRDLKKLRRRVMAVTSTSLAVVAVMSALTWTAMSARQLAEQRRQDAEGQIEFMITDLKTELEAIGRLKPLDAIGERAANYYAGYPLASHDADALGRRARVFHMLGDINDRQGRFEAASTYFRQAYAATEALLAKTPDDPDRVFEHAQSTFWVGYSYFAREDVASAEDYFEEYAAFADRLGEVEGNTERVVQERIYALTNLGMVAMAAGRTDKARVYLDRTVDAKLARLDSTPDDIEMRLSVVNSLSELARLSAETGHFEDAEISLLRASSLLDDASEERDDFRWISQRLTILRSLANVQLLSGEFEAADRTLSLARVEASRMAAIEAGSVDVTFELMQLDNLAFYLAYMREDLHAARTHSATLGSRLRRLDASATQDHRLAPTRDSVMAYPLYLAVLANDDADARRQAAELLSVSEISQTPRLLRARLLSHAVLGTRPDQSPDCATEDNTLSLTDRAAWNGFDPALECANDSDPEIHTIFRTALKRLTPPSKGD